MTGDNDIWGTLVDSGGGKNCRIAVMRDEEEKDEFCGGNVSARVFASRAFVSVLMEAEMKQCCQIKMFGWEEDRRRSDHALRVDSGVWWRQDHLSRS